MRHSHIHIHVHDAFEAAQHPRAQGGQFGAGGGSSNGGASEVQREAVARILERKKAHAAKRAKIKARNGAA